MYQRALENIKAAKSMRIVSRQRHEGVPVDAATSEVGRTLRTWIEFASDPCDQPTRLRMESRDGTGKPIATVVYSQPTSMQVNHTTNRYSYSEGIALDAIDGLVESFPQWYLGAACDEDGWELNSLVGAWRDGTTKVAAIECDVVRLKFAGKRGALVTLAIGREDGLPHLVTGSRAIEVIEVALDTHAAPGDLVLGPPAGYSLVPSMESRDAKFPIGERAPAFALRDASGSELTLDSLTGRVVVLALLPVPGTRAQAVAASIQPLWEAFSSKPVSIYGVACSGKVAAELVADRACTYEFLTDPAATATAFQCGDRPMIVVLGRDGVVLAATGSSSPEAISALHAAIERAIKE